MILRMDAGVAYVGIKLGTDVVGESDGAGLGSDVEGFELGFGVGFRVGTGDGMLVGIDVGFCLYNERRVSQGKCSDLGREILNGDIY